MRWTMLKKTLLGLWGEYGMFLVFGVVLNWAGVSLQLIGVSLFGLYLARGGACAKMDRWVDEHLSPGSEGGLSPMYPRVWTFELRLTKSLIEEITAKMSGERGSLIRSSLSNHDGFLRKVIIDEYINRVRIHRWLISESNGSRYDWFDLDKSQSIHWNFERRRGSTIWDYATEEMTDGELTLSCSWERDERTRKVYLQLALWVRDWNVAKEAPPGHVLFKIPLEPGRLYDEREKTVYVTGQGLKEFKAGNLEMFPYDEDNWEAAAPDETWRWYLSMNTFHTYCNGVSARV